MPPRTSNKFSENDIAVANTISKIYSCRCFIENDRAIWISTREIANACNLNIYQARYSLLKLKACGLVIQHPALKTSLGWKPSEAQKIIS